MFVKIRKIINKPKKKIRNIVKLNVNGSSLLGDYEMRMVYITTIKCQHNRREMWSGPLRIHIIGISVFFILNSLVQFLFLFLTK